MLTGACFYADNDDADRFVLMMSQKKVYYFL